MFRSAASAPTLRTINFGTRSRRTSHVDGVRRKFRPLRAPMSAMAVATLPETAPSWDELKVATSETDTGKKLMAEEAAREKGEGDPHVTSKLRLFGAKEEDVRVTLYRDHAGWCPYCQKVWMMMEEKKIPYRIERINMRSYGDKPDWFLKKVPSGLLPVLELDGKMITESLVIMQVLEQNFPDIPMIPEEEFDRANELLGLERKLFSDWCGLIFRPSMPGPFGGGARKDFEETLDKVNAALGVLPGPWFLGGDIPSIVDLQYVSHVERMNASCLYWKGMQLRGTERWANIERWFAAFEERPSYHACKSDYYTHVMDIPPQYGPGFSDSNKEVEIAQNAIDGVTTWKLPLNLSSSDMEPLPDSMNPGDEASRHEAAYKLAANSKAIVKFACRGMGEKGAKQFSAPLADPYAKPNLNYETKVDEMLRLTVSVLLDGSAQPSSSSETKNKEVAKCLAYLRDRVGVPRDMSYPAAMQLRAHLNLVINAI